MDFIITVRIKEKLLDKHGVTEREIEQCFLNREGKFLFDLRAQHVTNPYTRWFIAKTNQGRILKVCFIPKPEGIFIRTAYEPNETEIGIYNEHGLQLK